MEEGQEGEELIEVVWDEGGVQPTPLSFGLFALRMSCTLQRRQRSKSGGGGGGSDDAANAEAVAAAVESTVAAVRLLPIHRLSLWYQTD